MSDESIIEIRHRVIMLNIARLYPKVTTDLALYKATRGAWIVGPRREKAEYAMAVYEGFVKEVYRIDGWYPAGTLRYETRPLSDFADKRRWEFKGAVATQDIRAKYVNQYVGKGTQNPVRYVNI
jgi:hypothetical protein